MGKKFKRLNLNLRNGSEMRIGLIDGSTENWLTSSMEVGSLAELKEISGIQTDIF